MYGGNPKNKKNEEKSPDMPQNKEKKSNVPEKPELKGQPLKRINIKKLKNALKDKLKVEFKSQP